MPDEDLSEAFDGPIIEPVTYRDPETKLPVSSDVTFARADMDYLADWCRQIKNKREVEGTALVNTTPGLPVPERIAELRRVKAEIVTIYQVLALQNTPAGMEKIVDDSLIRGGVSDAKLRKAIWKGLGIGQTVALVENILSEPKPTILQFREAIRKRAIQNGYAPAVVNAMSDEQLIELAREKDPVKQFSDGTDAKGNDGTDPLAGSGEQSTPSSTST
jgi:hypothetical protein